MSHPITPKDIEIAMQPWGNSVSSADINDLLDALQEDIEDLWDEYLAAIENGQLEIVTETDDILVLADHSGQFWQELLDSLVNYTNLLGAEAEESLEIIMAAHRNAATRLSEHNWSAVNPLLVETSNLPSIGKERA